MPRYAALLRGINVGGKNIIKMADLRAAFEGMGLTDVETYIQSGNVVFSSSERSARKLVAPIAKMLASTFDYDATLAVLTKAQVKKAVDGAPSGFGDEPKTFRYDVMFLLPPLTANKALPDIPVREGVDTATAGPGVVYFTRRIAQASKSRLSRIAGLPLYQQMTVRNWNTTTRLLQMVSR
jgi:uncharacterized protein (DUF1697 family)